MNIQNTAHFVMQSKGGSGKSVVSALLAQYLREIDGNLSIIDTDPSNKTLGSYKALDVQKIEVLNSKKLVDQSKFDGFINEFLSNNNPMIVDTGSGDFLAINGYIFNYGIASIFKETGKQLYIHVPVNFGQSKEETLKCLYDISVNQKDAMIIVWENEFFGENTQNFLKPLLPKLNNLAGIVKIRKMDTDTEEQDFSRMLEQSLTFNEIREKTDDARFGIIQKIRLERVKKEIWEQLDDIFAPSEA